MKIDDQYYNIENSAIHEIKIKGSRFIGYAALTETREQAEAFIAKISGQNYNATHNCMAFRVGLGDKSIFRYSDDGEPSGTAGKPIQDAIDGRGLTGITCVVTRYYGGTKLGCGGLVRAYGGCASEVLDKAGKKICYIYDTVRIAYDYDLTGVIMHLIDKHAGSITLSEYSEKTIQDVSLRLSRMSDFKRQLVDATAGKVAIIVKEYN
ncbi:YigZ family protein [bacterium]|nr:YigZ family protein [bacterium]